MFIIFIRLLATALYHALGYSTPLRITVVAPITGFQLKGPRNKGLPRPPVACTSRYLTPRRRGRALLTVPSPTYCQREPWQEINPIYRTLPVPPPLALGINSTQIITVECISTDFSPHYLRLKVHGCTSVPGVFAWNKRYSVSSGGAQSTCDVRLAIPRPCSSASMIASATSSMTPPQEKSRPIHL
ncbi:hypothetical protein B0H14DRAFT_2754577 [Mycena olivaceomarginata]|nr:hypothetical protein B0H14DRAFT_2754577 [Mycena olivaceomarginata]